MNTPDNEDSENSHSKEVTVAFQTVGCKLNQAESESLARKFIEWGFRSVGPEEHPDVYILNTCTVTHVADRKCRQYLRSFRRKNPESLIVAIGCFPERSPEVAQVEGVDIAIGNNEKDRLVEIVDSQFASRKAFHGHNGHRYSTGKFRTRSIIKIQDGCNHGCSYCIVPYVRGEERSIPAEMVLSEIDARTHEGYQEIVLTGTRIGRYEGGLEKLIERILDQTSIPRLRLSSLQPNELSSGLINLWKSNDRICQHIHMALQNGSDSVLHRMGRGYTINDYEKAVNLMRDAMPDIAITTDIIVGFPGETEAEFEESYQFCEKVGFANIHVFPYSPRTGTAAAQMKNRIPEKNKKVRSQIMLDLARKSSRKFRQRFQGDVMPVLWEEQKQDRKWMGHTGNYIGVYTQSNESLANYLVNTKLGREYNQGLWGEVIPLNGATGSLTKGE